MHSSITQGQTRCPMNKSSVKKEVLSAVGDMEDSLLQTNSMIDSGLSWSVENQDDEGFWNSTLETNACMEAQWLMALYIMDIDDPEKTKGFAQGIADRQRDDGSWEIYYDATMGDANATIESYAALRLAGYDPESEIMSKARDWMFENNALSRARVFTRYWLALIGEWPWDKVPNLPPEIIYFPKWFPFNIYNFASWARATLLPLAILSAKRVTKPFPEDRRLDELFPDGREKFDYTLPKHSDTAWSTFFYKADKVLHKIQDRGLVPAREAACRKVSQWVIDHQDDDGCWGGIQPPWVYSVMALHTEYSIDHPAVQKGLHALDTYWTYTVGDGLYIQASESPIWDTLLTLLAVHECDAGTHLQKPVAKAIDWILAKENKNRGDWAQQTPQAEPGGWAFERSNAMYPDVDDSAVAILALNGLKDSYQGENNIQAIEQAVWRAKNWVLAMQCRNGGWGAFDRNNDKDVVARIPFSDFGEVLDPPSVDVTAHVIEALAPMRAQDPNIQKALDAALAYVKSEQEDDGSWFGRWGVNHIYGTAAVLPALAIIGEDMSQQYVLDAADWIVEHQNDDGGWGESCASYMDDSFRGVGVSTSTQTAWALMALEAVNHPDYIASIKRGVSYLYHTQENGSWESKQFTGTGFPGYGVGSRLNEDEQKRRIKLLQGNELGRGFMLNYTMYKHYFPLIALGRVRKILESI